ncbi:MAG: DUF6069 family protein [Candidatus Dormibacteria bacterium]
MSVATTVRRQPAPARTHPTMTRAIAVGGAVVAALAVWVVSVPLLGVQLLIRFGSGPAQTVGLAYVVGASLLGSLAGWGLLAVLERRSARPAQLWTRIAAIGTLISLGLPLGLATTAAARTSLALMHVAVGGVLILVLRRPVTGRAPADA